MKTRYFLVEQGDDGKLTAHAVTDNTSLHWARNKARAISGLNSTIVHVCAVRESVDASIPPEAA